MAPSFTTHVIATNGRRRFLLHALFFFGFMGQPTATFAATSPKQLAYPVLTSQSETQKGVDISGTWQATLPGNPGGRLVLKVAKDDRGVLDALVYNIDLNGKAIPTTEFLFQKRELELAVGSMSARFQGRLNEGGDLIAGTWKQNGAETSLAFRRASEKTSWVIPAAPNHLSATAKDAPGVYEVATIKFAEPGQTMSGLRISGRRFTAINSTVSDMIQFGYDLHSEQIVSDQEWIGKERFDVTMLFAGEEHPNGTQCQGMVQEVLAERFGFKFHRGSQELRVYVLAVGKNSPRLTKSEGDPDGLPGFRIPFPGDLGAENATMTEFANTLQRMVMDHPVLDHTGLSGRWDFGLGWTPDETQFHGDPIDKAANSSLPDLFTAIKQQLGLTLEPTKTATTTLIIDHIDRPSEN